jgi:hypothetical protein
MFKRFDAGEDSDRRFNTLLDGANDCTVRALSKARGIPYDDAWELLHEFQRKTRTCQFNLFAFLHIDPVNSGYKDEVKVLAGMTIREFAKAHPKGRFVVRKKGHIVAIVDGDLFDTTDSGGLLVENAFEVYPNGKNILTDELEIPAETPEEQIATKFKLPTARRGKN